MGAFLIPAGILAAKAAKSYFGHKAKKKQNNAQRSATTAQLTIGQKQREDARRAKVSLGGSILGNVPKTTAGGAVNTGVAIDPELLKQLGVERTYDFQSAVPDNNAGSGSAFLSGLFGDVGDTLAGAYGGLGSGGTAPWQDVSKSAGVNPWGSSGASLPGGGRNIAALNMLGGTGGNDAGTISWEDLMRQGATGGATGDGGF